MAGVIKADGRTSTPLGVQTVAFNLEDINVQADAYLGTVRQQAATIIAQANRQASQVIKVAQQQGEESAQRTAHKVVEAKLNEQLQTLLPALDKAIQSIHQAREAWLRRWEQKAVHLAVAIAARVLRSELRHRTDVPLVLVREALELAAGASRIKLHFNPQDFEALAGQVKTLLETLSHLAPTEIVASPEVSAGGCLVKTEFGEIDQRFEAQLARIEKELT